MSNSTSGGIGGGYFQCPASMLQSLLSVQVKYNLMKKENEEIRKVLKSMSYKIDELESIIAEQKSAKVIILKQDPLLSSIHRFDD